MNPNLQIPERLTEYSVLNKESMTDSRVNPEESATDTTRETYAISSNFIPLSLECNRKQVLWSVISTALRRCLSRAPVGNSVIERRLAVRVPFGTMDWRRAAMAWCGVDEVVVVALLWALRGGESDLLLDSLLSLLGLSFSGLSSSRLPLSDLSKSSGSSSIRVDSRLMGRSETESWGEEPLLLLFMCRLPAAPIILALIHAMRDNRQLLKTCLESRLLVSNIVCKCVQMCAHKQNIHWFATNLIQ